MGERLYYLDQVRGAVMTARPDGSDVAVLVDGCAHPDGIVVASGHVYWTNMGADFDAADGSIERVRLDGSERMTLVPKGATRTPKQLRVDVANGQLYWCDREGMRVMRSRLDGTAIETLFVAGDAERDRGDATRWCVGLALDAERRLLYWTQKGPTGGGKGRICRAPIDRLKGHGTEPDAVELLFDALPEPVDLELGHGGDALYWTDRARGPGGGTLHRAWLDPATGAPGTREVLVVGLDQPIGIALDEANARVFVSDLGGNVHAGDLQRRRWQRVIEHAGKLTGLALY